MIFDTYQFQPKGYLRWKETRYSNDRIVSEKFKEKPNLIVTSARQSFATLLTDPDDHDYLIRYLALGQGHHALGEPDTPIDPVVSETSLEDEEFRKSYTSASFPDSTSVEYYTKIERTEANGCDWYTEIGLFSDNVMFAINVPDDGRWEKNPDIELEFWWRLLF